MIQSVRKAMQILTVISDGKGDPVSVAEIAEKTAFPKPTCVHLLATLREDGYVKKVSHTAGYVLGPSTHYLSRYGRYENEMISLARPVMRWMEQKTHATVILAVIQNGHKYIIEHLDNEQNLFADHPTIKTGEIYRTATGRAILAQMDREEVEAVWRSNGPPPPEEWEGVTTYEELLGALREIRKQAVVTSEAPRAADGAKGIACPLFVDASCVGAIGIAWKPTEDTEEERAKIEKRLRDVLLRGSREICRRLSCDI